MSWFKVFLLNVIIALVLLFSVEKFLSFKYGNQTFDYTNRPNFTSVTNDFFKDYRDWREYKYKSFLGWVAPQRTSFSININDQGRRITYNPPDNKNKFVIHLFGGSSVWGYGVNDANTIPSHLAKNMKLTVTNFGEQGYNSRQSLNLLLNEIKDIKPNDIVIFYDGANEIWHNCEPYTTFNGHQRNQYFIEAINERYNLKKSVEYNISNTKTFQYMLDIIESYFPKVSKKVDNVDYKDVCKNADRVSEFLFYNWKTASLLVKKLGAKFECMLQPLPATYTKGDLNYSDDIANAKAMKVYGLIRKKAMDLDCFKDLSNDMQKDYFIDAGGHLNEYGNADVANQISIYLKQKYNL